MSHGSGRGGSDDAEVLLLERDDGLREPFRIWLDERWDVVTAADATEARDRFDPSLDAVVTSDHLLLETPESLIESFAEDGFDRPVLVLVSRMERPDVECLDVQYLTKPVTKADLVEAVADLVDD
ncbi:MAG: hypothetical protein ABEJ68_00415 [Halobacteriaceae archaeon]